MVVEEAGEERGGAADHRAGGTGQGTPTPGREPHVGPSPELAMRQHPRRTDRRPARREHPLEVVAPEHEGTAKNRS